MLIGLAGRAGAGKDTVAGMIADIVACSGGTAVVAGFADPIYDAIAAITGIPADRLRDRQIKEETIGWVGKSPRELAQTLGTEWGRQMVHPDLWVRAAMRLAEARRATGISTVFSDVRFANEAKAIHNAGGRVFKIVRPGFECLSEGASSHSSEAGIEDDLVDAIVFNDGDLVHLRERVERAIMQ